MSWSARARHGRRAAAGRAGRAPVALGKRLTQHARDLGWLESYQSASTPAKSPPLRLTVIRLPSGARHRRIRGAEDRMSHSEGVSRREFVATVGGAAVGAAVAGSTSVRRPGQAPLRHRRHRRARHRHVGPPHRATIRRRGRVRRPVRHQPAARRSREEADGRLVPDLHQLRPDDGQGEAGSADGHHRRRLSQRVHREGARVAAST